MCVCIYILTWPIRTCDLYEHLFLLTRLIIFLCLTLPIRKCVPKVPFFWILPLLRSRQQVKILKSQLATKFTRSDKTMENTLRNSTCNRDSFMDVAWFILIRDMTCSHVWHDLFIRVTRLINVCFPQARHVAHSYVWQDSVIRVTSHTSFMYVTWLMNMGCTQAHYVTHSYVWHDAFICVTWLFYMRDMTRSYVWHDSFMCVTWLVVHMCDNSRYRVAKTYRMSQVAGHFSQKSH